MFYHKDGKIYCIKNVNGGNYRSGPLTAEEIRKWHNSGGDKVFKCNLFLTLDEYQEYQELTGAEEMKMLYAFGLPFAEERRG